MTQMPTQVAEKFATYPDSVRDALLQLRRLIFDVAANDPRIGDLEECLKWGQPAYRPKRARVGTTVRMDATGDDGYAIYYHCQSKLGEQYDALYRDRLRLDHRTISISVDNSPDSETLRHCIQMALTYHLPKAPSH